MSDWVKSCCLVIVFYLKNPCINRKLQYSEKLKCFLAGTEIFSTVSWPERNSFYEVNRPIQISFYEVKRPGQTCAKTLFSKPQPIPSRLSYLKNTVPSWPRYLIKTVSRELLLQSSSYFQKLSILISKRNYN